MVGLRAVVFAPVLVAAVRRDVDALPAAFVSAAATGSAVETTCKRDIKRDLRRAAALGWMIPFWAALSSARTAARTTSATSSPPALTDVLAFLKKVRTDDRAAWLRAVRRSAWRIAFCAELVLATLCSSS